jgi:hypothetical protein
MLNTLPAPILLDIAIFFTALAWGLGAYLVDKKVYIFASLAMLRLLIRVQRGKLGRTSMGGGWSTNSFRLLASVVRSKKTAEDARRLCRNLVDLHRVPYLAQQITPFRFAHSRMETALVNFVKGRV